MLIITATEQGPICILVGSAGHAGFGIKRLTAILTIAFKKSAGAAGVGKMTAQDGLVGGAGGGMVATLS